MPVWIKMKFIFGSLTVHIPPHIWSLLTYKVHCQGFIKALWDSAFRLGMWDCDFNCSDQDFQTWKMELFTFIIGQTDLYN